MKILAIETSCDETAAAVVEDGVKVLSNVVASSAAMHEKYGGIVPEIAAREQLRCIIPVIQEALSGSDPSFRDQTLQPDTIDTLLPPPGSGLRKLQGQTPLAVINRSIDAIAVTVGPGLIGSLLVGVETAKTIAAISGKPLIPVNHVIAHMYANFVRPSTVIARIRQLAETKQSLLERLPRPAYGRARNDISIEFPAISLVVSGGHTELYLMKSIKELKWLGGTLDDAAGECFDKTARLLGFGSRGGVAIQEAASQYQISNSKYQIKLPRPMLDKKNELNFSFSGLKTAILREVNKLKDQKQFNNSTIQQLAFEVQEAITDVLVKKTLLAAEKYDAQSILLSGGVAANTRLREKFLMKLRTHEAPKLSLFVPPAALCTDNAAYVGSYAYFRGKPINWQEVTALPDLSVENI